MRDVKDQPILNTAIVEDLDFVITGDKDFLALDLSKPECITAAEYCERFMKWGLDEVPWYHGKIQALRQLRNQMQRRFSC